MLRAQADVSRLVMAFVVPAECSPAGLGALVVEQYRGEQTAACLDPGLGRTLALVRYDLDLVAGILEG